MPDVLLHSDPLESRFVYLTGSRDQPLPAAVREIIKVAPYFADWIPAEKRWRIPAGAQDSLLRSLSGQGWEVARGSISPAKGGRRVAQECQACGQPYRWDYSGEGKACRSCGERLILIPPPTTAPAAQDGQQCSACSHLVRPGRDRFCPCGEPVTMPLLSRGQSTAPRDHIQQLRAMLAEVDRSTRLDQ